ncbi:hypothetical protein SDC9_181309 [bioreactor metagenome]|uniref:Uncharacterized protein n=1 Tax=bioreactor metagenome TaxID=1076179 RepID=A0A645H474_9ZZZZ
MTLSFDALVKMQLFERCASPAAFEYLANKVFESDLGHAAFLGPIEEEAAQGLPYREPDQSWGGASFYEQWIGLAPRLADIDLRPFIYLSRDKAPTLAHYDELSPAARELLEVALKTDKVSDVLIRSFKDIGEQEADRVLTRLVSRARTENWAPGAIVRCFNLVEAYPGVAPILISALGQAPAVHRSMQFAPLLAGKAWSVELIRDWMADKATPEPVRKYFQVKGKV